MYALPSDSPTVLPPTLFRVSESLMVCFLTEAQRCALIVVRGNVQCGQVLLREAVLFVTPFMQVHTAVIAARRTTKKRHAIFGRSITCTHQFGASARRWSAVHDGDALGSVFAPVVGDVQANDRRTRARRCALCDDDLGDLAILAEVVVRAQCRDELTERASQLVKGDEE
jgi:hypothetical protein